MSTLSERFEEARNDIMNPDLKGKHHYPLLEIMREAANGKREYDPQAIAAAGIDPDEFMTAWAVGWAKSSLSKHGETHPVYFDNMVRCCQIAIATEGPHPFGKYLPEPYQTQIREKLAKAGVLAGPAPDHP